MMSKKLRHLATLSLVVSSMSAGAMGSSSPSASATIHSARWEGKHSDARDWTVHTYNEVSKVSGKLLTTKVSDVKEFCPQYTSLSQQDKRNFWTYFLSSVAQLESNFRPEHSYREAFNDGAGNRVMSRGLLQLSLESGNAYGCGFTSQSNVHNAYKNLSCGLRILNRWVVNDGRIAGKISGSWRGGARYWSVLRTSSKVNSIKSWTRAYCNSKFR